MQEIQKRKTEKTEMNFILGAESCGRQTQTKPCMKDEKKQAI